MFSFEFKNSTNHHQKFFWQEFLVFSIQTNESVTNVNQGEETKVRGRDLSLHSPLQQQQQQQQQQDRLRLVSRLLYGRFC